MNNLSIRDAGFNMSVNVNLTLRDKHTGEILDKRIGHNRCLKTQLMGFAKLLNGEFNISQPELLTKDWIPRYLAVGTNVAKDSTSAVTSSVKITDTQLLNEISPRLKLPEKYKLINRSNQDYIQVIINTYLPDDRYNNQWIGEAGLFANETGNNCLFRIVFNPIHKTETTVVEVTWTISIISVDSQNNPYTEVDKSGLYTAMNQLLTKYGEKYSDIKESASYLGATAISTFASDSVSQQTVDSITKKLSIYLQDLSTK